MANLPEPSRPPTDYPPRVRLVKGQEVSLGCSTLILIALIVLFFSQGGTGNVEREVRLLRSELEELKKAVDRQTRQIEALQDKFDKAKAKE